MEYCYLILIEIQPVFAFMGEVKKQINIGSIGATANVETSM